MDIEELTQRTKTTLERFYVKYRELPIINGQASLLAVEGFGLMVCCTHRLNYIQVRDFINEHYGDWRHFFVEIEDDSNKKRYELLWALMRCGYMKWLRINFPRQIRNVIMQDNLGRLIIEERLRIWANKTKYKFLIEDNQAALKSNMLSELTQDNGFFDYMPEEE